MITIGIITFRESLEMILLVGILFASLGQNSKSQNKTDLILGSVVGLMLTSFLFILLSIAGSQLRLNISHDGSEIMESINYIVSGIFLFITAILLHQKIKHTIQQAPALIMHTSLFAVGFLSILREGVEILLFSISSSLSTSFFSSLVGFILGIGIAILLGLLGNKIISTKLSHVRLLFIADWGIKLLSLYFFCKGIVGISEFIF